MSDSPIPTPFVADKPMAPADLARWNQARIQDTWRVFRIMSEFVEGFERMGSIGPSVSVFGSARTQPGTPDYELGVAVGQKLAERGFAVITGGGPGIMEAGNRGAQVGGGASVGLNIKLPHEQSGNPYIDPTRSSRSTSSSRARRCSSSTPRATSSCPAASGRWTSSSRA